MADTTRCEVLEWLEAVPAGEERWPVTVRAHLRYTGQLTGEGHLEGQLYGDGVEHEVEFSGRERFDGSVCGKTGSFVLRHEGLFSKGCARSDWTVERGSGTRGLEGIRGEGHSELPVEGEGEVEFAPRLPGPVAVHAGADRPPDPPPRS